MVIPENKSVYVQIIKAYVQKTSGTRAQAHAQDSVTVGRSSNTNCTLNIYPSGVLLASLANGELLGAAPCKRELSQWAPLATLRIIHVYLVA